MGGRGGGSYFNTRDLEYLREEAKRRLEQSRIDAEVNSALHRELAAVNDRDVDRINGLLAEIETALESRIGSVDRLLFGGSVAKHTYVDGLSDIDLLVVLKDENLSSQAPGLVREEFRDALRRDLPQGEVQEIRAGRLAVTVQYRDGNEIQLLPAVQSSGVMFISSADGDSWKPIDPQAFAKALTTINERQGKSVVPTIKLAKAVFAARLGSKAPTGYHVEALAIAAFQDYAGPRAPKDMLIRLTESASRDVLRPIRDVTGQSPHVDDYLGARDSAVRLALSHRLRLLGKTMATASISEWRAMFE